MTAPAETGSPTTGKRVGHTISIIVNAAMILVANNILDWNWFPWLTDSWNDVLPLINLSLLASIVVSVVYIWFDADWFKSLTQAVLAGIALVVTIRLYQVYPFDFSAYEFNWETFTRAVLILAMIGITIGMVAESVKFVVALVRRSTAGTLAS